MSTTENVLKAPSKWILIKESKGGLSNAPVKTTSIIDPKYKGKFILIKQSEEENKKL